MDIENLKIELKKNNLDYKKIESLVYKNCMVFRSKEHMKNFMIYEFFEKAGDDDKLLKIFYDKKVLPEEKFIYQLSHSLFLKKIKFGNIHNFKGDSSPEKLNPNVVNFWKGKILGLKKTLTISQINNRNLIPWIDAFIYTFESSDENIINFLLDNFLNTSNKNELERRFLQCIALTKYFKESEKKIILKMLDLLEKESAITDKSLIYLCTKYSQSSELDRFENFTEILNYIPENITIKTAEKIASCFIKDNLDEFCANKIKKITEVKDLNNFYYARLIFKNYLTNSKFDYLIGNIKNKKYTKSELDELLTLLTKYNFDYFKEAVTVAEAGGYDLSSKKVFSALIKSKIPSKLNIFNFLLEKKAKLYSPTIKQKTKLTDKECSFLENYILEKNITIKNKKLPKKVKKL